MHPGSNRGVDEIAEWDEDTDPSIAADQVDVFDAVDEERDGAERTGELDAL